MDEFILTNDTHQITICIDHGVFSYTLPAEQIDGMADVVGNMQFRRVGTVFVPTN